MKLTHTEYQAIVESSPNMIWRAGTDADCNYFNETWLKFTGKSMEAEIGAGWLQGVHPDDMDYCMAVYLPAFHKREPFEMEYRLKRHDGQWRWINDQGVPFFDAVGNFSGYIGSCVDVTERVEGRKLTDMAHNDYLTGLFNRNYLDHLVASEFQSARREHSITTCMMIDIDQFKHFNDTYGHTCGDQVLYFVAQKISACVRDSDIVGRYGGDEFLIILPNATVDDARVIAQRMLLAVQTVHLDGVEHTVTISIGIASYSNEACFGDILKKADSAMYRVKKDGGNTFSF